MKSIASAPPAGLPDDRPGLVSRRGALATLGLAAGVTAFAPSLALAAPAAPAPAATARRHAPVTAYFHDGLVRDESGQLPAFRAPGGHRGAARIGRMNELELRMAGVAI